MSYRLPPYANKEFALELPEHPPHGNVFSTIIGPNGSGKSRLLADIAATMKAELKGERAEQRRLPRRVLAISNMVYDRYPLSSREREGYVYLGVRQGANMVTTGVWAEQTNDAITALWESPESIDRLAPALNLLGITIAEEPQLALQPYARTSWEKRLAELNDADRSYRQKGAPDTGLERLHLTSIAQLIQRLPSAKRRDRSFNEDYRSWAGVHVLHEVAADNDVEALELLELLLREKLVYTRVVFRKIERLAFVSDLSAGEQLVLSNAARVVRFVQPDSLILIDEPETGLHPEWQSRFVPMMREMIPEWFGCHFIIATHSPHIVVEGTQLLVPGEAHGTFKPFEGQHEGRSVENLLYRAFESRTSHNIVVETDLALLIRAIGRGRVDINGVQKTNEAMVRLKRIAGPDTPEVNKILAQAADLVSKKRT